MDNEFESIIKIIKNVKLNDDEKFFMFKNIIKNESTSIVSPYQGIRSSYFFSNRFKFVPALVIVFVVISAGGVSAFAEKSIPEDFLYVIKTAINEPIAGVFAVTKEEKTKWQKRLVERRLAEAQKLVSDNNLNKATRVVLEKKIKERIDDFNIKTNELVKENGELVNPSELNITMQASLNAYQSVLEKISEERNIEADTKQETEKLLTALGEYKNQVKDNRKNFELNTKKSLPETSEDSDSAFGKQKMAENALSSVQSLYQKEKENLSINIQNQINDNLVGAETILEEGKTAIAFSDFATAIEKFQLVISYVNETKLLMLSNVIKRNIEDDMGIDRKYSKDIDGDDNEDDSNSSIQESNKLEFQNSLNELSSEQK